MAAPFSNNNHTPQQMGEIVNEIVSAILEEGIGNGLIKVDINIDLVGHGLRPFGDYGEGAYRDFSVRVGRKKWEGLTNNDLAHIRKYLKVEGFERVMGELCTELYEWSPTMEMPRAFVKFGKPCAEFDELAKLVTKKYGITLGVKDLYIVTRDMFDEKDMDDPTYIAYAPYRCKQLTDIIKSFGRKKTTCEKVTLDEKTTMGQYNAIRRLVTLKVTNGKNSVTPEF